MSEDAREDSLVGAERELESALRSLAPTPSSIDPIAAAFEAGRRSQAHVTRIWRGTGIAASLAATVLLFISVPHRSADEHPQPEVRVVSFTSAIPSEQSVLHLRNVVLEHGWGALPPTPGSGGSGRTITARDML